LGLYQAVLGPCCDNMRMQDETSLFCGQRRYVSYIFLCGCPHQKNVLEDL